jgi:hypothetical protein
MTTDAESTGSDPRQLAVARLRKKREFWQHLAVYVVVNAAATLIWVFTTPDGFYWPMFLLLAWGIGLVLHGLNAFTSVFTPAPPSEAQIQREIHRLTGR